MPQEKIVNVKSILLNQIISVIRFNSGKSTDNILSKTRDILAVKIGLCRQKQFRKPTRHQPVSDPRGSASNGRQRQGRRLVSISNRIPSPTALYSYIYIQNKNTKSYFTLRLRLTPSSPCRLMPDRSGSVGGHELSVFHHKYITSFILYLAPHGIY